jgi:N-acetylmuramoyl-L-alanine amidase
MSFEIVARPLSYIERLENRNTDCIELVVIHCTELPDLDMARTWGKKIVHTESQTGNSGHFYIERDGHAEEWVPAEYVAHHVRGRNENSLGIELVNTGRYPNWFHTTDQQMTERYPRAQINALIILISELCVKFPMLRQIAGHEDLDTTMIPADDDPAIMINRKLDPGPCFPWQDVLSRVPLKRINR